MSLELIGGLIKTGADEPSPEFLRAIAGRTRIISLPNRIIGLCRMPNGKTVYASTSLVPIRKQVAPAFVAQMQNRPGWGWGSIKASFKAVVKIKGIGKVTRLIGKAAIKIKPFVGRVRFKGLHDLAGKVLGKVPITAPFATIARKSGIHGTLGRMWGGLDGKLKLKAAAKAAHPKVHATIDAAARGDASARATIRGVHSKARSDPRAAKALAQLRIVNKVRTNEAVESVVRLTAVVHAAKARAAIRMPPNKAAHVARRLDDVAKTAAAMIPATAAMRALEPNAATRAWIFQLCGRIQQVAAVPMPCEPAGAVAGFLGTGPMTLPTGTGIFAWLRRQYLAGIR